MWDNLTKYRKKWFTSFDEASDTLEEVRFFVVYSPSMYIVSYYVFITIEIMKS